MTQDGPGERRPLAAIRVHPAVIILGSLFVTSFVDGLWKPAQAWPSPLIVQQIGTGVLVLGVVVLLSAYWSMARARTTIDPRRHTTRIVVSGVYRISRNPIYLGWFLFILGAGLRRVSVVQVLLAFLMIGLLHWAVVLHEERYLEGTFGDDYVRYKAHVRRWL